MRWLPLILALLLLASETAAQGPPTMEEALSLKEEGKCSEAIRLFEALLPAPEAFISLGECLEEEADYQGALKVWQNFLSLYPQDFRAPLIPLRIGRLYKKVNNPQAAIQAYLLHAQSGGLLSEVAWEEVGDLYRGMGYYREAVKAYREAFKISNSFHLREKILETLAEAKDHKGAMVECTNLESLPLSAPVRVRINYLCGRIYREAGALWKAFSLFRRAVELFPESPYAYFSLIELVEAGKPVDDYLRGLVDYHACFSYPQACGAALLAFGRYIAANPVHHKPEAHYYAAIIYRRLGDYQASLREWDWLIQTHPDSPLVPEGWWEKGRTLEQAGRITEALAIYQKLADFYPDSPFALKALKEAARLMEEKGDFASASSLYLKASRIAASSEEQKEALFKAGLVLYRAGNLDAAVELWRGLDNSRALFWIGKALMKQGRWAEARSYWERAHNLAPESYYGLRALASLRRFDFASGHGYTKPGQELSPETLKDWLSTWSSLSPSGVESDPRWAKARAFMMAGYRDKALVLYRNLYREYSQDPKALAFLTFYFRREKLYSLSIRSAMSLVWLAQRAGVSLPPELWELSYPFFFTRLIEQEASFWKIDPLLLAAVIRQESLFDPWVSSPAGAIGLMQIIPPTGKSIASALGWPNFSEKLLERPWVSLKFGTWYLVRQKERFGHWFVALAAYNAGPLRAAKWWEQAGYDPDLFVEIIPIEETSRYVRAIYEQYAIYQKIYRE
ncbi:MAG: tetratricopeptide repeat protein [Anaerolineae bacterium]|nr:tetratricopeptide repeat protein [Anaerolineae bacterium]MDW8101630.1 tetratricopeptide repeat protein [Anaerolineae bacterium]